MEHDKKHEPILKRRALLTALPIFISVISCMFLVSCSSPEDQVIQSNVKSIKAHSQDSAIVDNAVIKIWKALYEKPDYKLDSLLLYEDSVPSLNYLKKNLTESIRSGRLLLVASAPEFVHGKSNHWEWKITFREIAGQSVALNYFILSVNKSSLGWGPTGVDIYQRYGGDAGLGEKITDVSTKMRYEVKIPAFGKGSYTYRLSGNFSLCTVTLKWEYGGLQTLFSITKLL